MLTRHIRASHYRNKVIPVTGQHRFKLRIGVQQRPQLARDGDSHVLLFGAIRANRARILAAVPGINGDNDFVIRRHRAGRRTGHGLIVGHRRLRGGHHRLPFMTRRAERIASRRHRPGRHHRRRVGPFHHHRRWRRRRRRVGVDGKDHRVIRPVLLLHRPGFAIFRQIHQQTQRLRILRRTGTNALHQVAAAKFQRQSLQYAGLFDIQRHQSFALGGKRVLRFTDKAKSNTGLLVSVGDLDIG